MNPDSIKRVALAAAYKGGRILRSFFGGELHIKKKGEIDLVTEADIRSEKIILETIGGAFPDHSILSEESGLSRKKEGGALWIIDPLDGTTNFAHSIPQVSISIAFAMNKEVLFGLVLNPIRGELFTGIKGRGAFLNGRPIKVSASESLSESLLVTGFPYNLKEHVDSLTEKFSAFLEASRGIRRLGSAALDLCFVACNRFDGFWEENLKPWDTAAGALIASEAGARITDFSGGPFDIYGNEILAAGKNLHPEMISILKNKQRG